tara:strand:- start:1254 stop:1853 length:600 start_codon:yes stop_codon:yes gene_type:complete
MKKVKISEIKKNPENPRFIKNDKFKKLVQSVKDFPKMLELRPIVVNPEMVILGGNMRYEACKEAGLEEVWIKIADELTQEEEKEFIIKDNSSFGEWDWDVLANEWEKEQLLEWGLDLPILNEKLQIEKGEEPEIQITEEILEEHNYLVFTFDNKLDWQVVKEIFKVDTVAKPGYTETYMQKGIGRVKSGKILLDVINKK